MNITPKQIKSQYDRVKRDNWLPWFEEAAEKANTTTAHFLAIGSRETNLKNIRGDFRNNRYNGFGVMQVDVGTDAEYAKNWKASDVEPSIRRGGEIYESKLDQVINGQGKSLTVKGKKFVGRKVQSDDARRIATSAYNCGLWAYFHFTNEAHIDSSTTGKDYSRDVYDRAIEFAALLEADGEAGALAREIQLQGKYASEDAKSRKKPLAGASVKEEVKHKAEEELQKKGPEETVASPQPEQSTPQINVEHADQVKADSPLPVEGGRKDDDPKQASQGGTKSTIATIIGGITGIGTAIGGWLSSNGSLAMVGIICLTIILLSWMFRQLIMDYLRVKILSDPTKINAK